MATRGNENNDDYIARLEREVSELQRENGTLKTKGGRKSRAQMRRDGQMSREDVMISDHILLLVQQYLFPRIKFLPKNWEVYDPNNKKNFAALLTRAIMVSMRMYGIVRKGDNSYVPVNSFEPTMNGIIVPVNSVKRYHQFSVESINGF